MIVGLVVLVAEDVRCSGISHQNQGPPPSLTLLLQAPAHAPLTRCLLQAQAPTHVARPWQCLMAPTDARSTPGLSSSPPRSDPTSSPPRLWNRWSNCYKTCALN